MADGYIDTHNHILPGLDDGPATLSGAVEMARVALKNGITKIVATPHHNNYHRPSKSEIMAVVKLLRAELRKDGVPIEVYPGNELRISPDLPRELREGEVLPLAESSYILFEFPFEGIPPFAEDVIFRMRIDGWNPILAHPERIYDIQRKPDRLKRYIDLGCIVQVNSSSLTGELDRACLDMAIELLKRGQVDILATDSHAPDRRAPDFTEALEVAAGYVGFERAQQFVRDNPAKIFEDKKRPLR
ncbi:CpsB/CapC family capsule biosynthesis tyrosine phosphatase [Candidatus Aquicultor secundus]|uniref:tyrosine-protein phosphatase n=1 Tax=Candidatus Aquicultor secundus TaxID=1973895 RepID=UPI000CAC6B6B|nr:CpsB/CapC family capsule biosynthesis tyrosine phosphatase [Candidatus Aquicultor secundus]PIU27049.1 MAG: hypothetical protein COT10_05595 [Candidatus Aquicultor secundus]